MHLECWLFKLQPKKFWNQYDWTTERKEDGRNQLRFFCVEKSKGDGEFSAIIVEFKIKASYSLSSLRNK